LDSSERSTLTLPEVEMGPRAESERGEGENRGEKVRMLNRMIKDMEERYIMSRYVMLWYQIIVPLGL